MRRVLARRYRPEPDSQGPSWLTLLGHTKDALSSVDLFRCESLILRTHWVMVVMDQFTRRIIGFAVRVGAVDGPATCGMFNQAVAAALTPPRHLSSDHDPLFEFHRWKANLRILDVTEIKTVPEVPLSHPFAERFVGTIRRELLDQVPFFERRRSRTEAVALQGLLQPRSRSCVVGLDARSLGYQHRSQTTRPPQVPVEMLLQRSVSAPGSCLTIIRHRQAIVESSPRASIAHLVPRIAEDYRRLVRRLALR